MSPSYPVSMTAVSAPDFGCCLPWTHQEIQTRKFKQPVCWNKGKQTGVWHTPLNVGL